MTDELSWPLAIAALITLALQAGKRFAPQIKSRIPQGYQWLTPIVAGILAAMLLELQLGKPLEEAATKALMEGLAIGLSAMGFDAGLSDSPVPWSGGKGGDKDDDDPPSPLRVASLVYGVMAVALLSTACSFIQQHAKTAQEAARHACAVYRADVDAIPEHEAAERFCATEEQLRAWKEAGEK